MTENEIISIKNKLLNHCKSFSVPEEAPGMKKYMRDQFEFLGLKKYRREEACKLFWLENPLPVGKSLKDFIKTLWAEPQRELQYIAMQLLEKPIKRSNENFLELLEYLVITKSWWDTVDYIAANLTGAFLKKNPELKKEVPEIWIESDNMWLRRSAIIYQLKFKQDTDTERLFQFVLKTANEKEFFIQKAQGWALREYAKTNPIVVIDFVKNNAHKLSNLTKREALKHQNKL
jgi:3-methyladenine DNA glycosylase AlkD